MPARGRLNKGSVSDKSHAAQKSIKSTGEINVIITNPAAYVDVGCRHAFDETLFSFFFVRELTECYHLRFLSKPRKQILKNTLFITNQAGRALRDVKSA